MSAPCGTKSYGLFIPKKKSLGLVKRASVFDDDSDEESSKQIEATIKQESFKSKLKKQTQIEVEKALAADPTVYEYDSIYDDMQAKKPENVAAKTKQEVDKKPKYIGNLLKTAEKRKKEYEKMVERQVQKEREAEGDEFADKDAFVTSAYKKKMQERQEEEERERQKELMEEAMDVRKQKDLSGFYRHFLNQTTGIGSSAPEVKKEDKQESSKAEQSSTVENIDKSSSDSEEEDKEKSVRIKSESDRNDRENSHRQSDRKDHHSSHRQHEKREKHRDEDRHKDKTHHRSSRKDEDRFYDDEKKETEQRSHHKEERRHRKHERQRDDSPKRHRHREESRHEHKDSGDSPRKHRHEEESRHGHQDKQKNPEDQISDRETATDNNLNQSSSNEGVQIIDENVSSKRGEEEPSTEKTVNKFARRNFGDSVDDARARYLARKANKKPVAKVEEEED